jgi:hypothetical protein
MSINKQAFLEALGLQVKELANDDVEKPGQEEEQTTSPPECDDPNCDHGAIPMLKQILQKQADLQSLDLARSLHHCVVHFSMDKDDRYVITIPSRDQRSLLELLVVEHYGRQCRDYKAKYLEIQTE